MERSIADLSCNVVKKQQMKLVSIGWRRVGESDALIFTLISLPRILSRLGYLTPLGGSEFHRMRFC